LTNLETIRREENNYNGRQPRTIQEQHHSQFVGLQPVQGLFDPSYIEGLIDFDFVEKLFTPPHAPSRFVYMVTGMFFT
jgi:hypothetical protein